MKNQKTGPLSGVTVLDLTRVMAGPYCTLMLSELGARVIKVEKPGTGDDTRQSGPFVEGRPVHFNSVNRNKESIALDLTQARDRAIFDQLLAHADVLTENYRPGVLAKLGYEWDALHQKYPNLIYASISGFGHTGPSSKLPGYDMVMQGLTGMMSITGEAGAGPCRVGISIGDIGSGLFGAIAINAALLHRARTGETTRIDLAMFDCVLALMETPFTSYLATGTIGQRIGSQHANFAPFEAFATADDYITLSCANDKTYRALCSALGREDLAADARFATNVLRVRNRAELHDAIESELLKMNARHWVGFFEERGVPVAPINDVKRALEHPQVAARNMVINAVDPVLGDVRMMGTPFKMSAFPDPVTRQVGPDLDGDRASILAEFGIVEDEEGAIAK